jgi:hypothetical protein
VHIAICIAPALYLALERDLRLAVLFYLQIINNAA